MNTPAADEAQDAASPANSSLGLDKEKRNAPLIWNRRPDAFSKRRLVILFASLGSIIAIALALGLGLGLGLHVHHAPESTPVNPIVDLGYTRYQGSNSSGVAQWLGMRYAAVPTGKLRFAAPAPPPRQDGVQSATQHGDKCLGVHTNSTEDTGNTSPSGHSEDCLFVEVYAPGNATVESRFPVYVYLQGGGFVQNSGTYNAAPLVKASGMQIVVVNINYRVGVHGFLAGEEVRKGGSLNNGLKDQRHALHWIKAHITKFGGNPDHVVLGGSSAGAASVTLQLAAYGGRDVGLFHATAAESQSFGALRTVEESQYQYDELVARTKCNSDHTKSDDTLACLRSLSSDALQAQNIGTPFPNATRRPLFAYNPTLDHDFIPDYTLNLFSSGRFLKLPAIYGDVTNEGTIFVPRSTDTIDDSNTFLQAQFPLLNNTQQEWIQKSYPPTDQQFSGKSGKYWRSTADAYGEMRYICPGMFLNNVYAAHGIKGNWNYHYAVLDPGANKSGMGTPHVEELNAIWGAPPGSPPSYKTVNARAVSVLQHYWLSFIKTFDPNALRLEGTPVWEEWTSSAFSGSMMGSKRILFADGGNTTVMESVEQAQWERCKVLTSNWGVALGQ
ncbi:MAG: hypothetical protein Q9218_005309 [Villophora microphyllina]